MKKKVCIICGKPRGGASVEDDIVLEFMRWFKRNVTKNAQNYDLYICKDCAAQYRKMRAKHVRRRTLYVALGVIFTISLLLVGGARNPYILVYGVGITFILYLLSLVSYMPPVADQKLLDKMAAAAPPKGTK